MRIGVDHLSTSDQLWQLTEFVEPDIEMIVAQNYHPFIAKVNGPMAFGKSV